jgi:hypothetical protein
MIRRQNLRGEKRFERKGGKQVWRKERERERERVRNSLFHRLLRPLPTQDLPCPPVEFCGGGCEPLECSHFRCDRCSTRGSPRVMSFSHIPNA